MDETPWRIQENPKEQTLSTTLQLQRNTIADDLDQLINRISNPGSAQKRSIADAVRQRVAENFTRQGSANGHWAALSPYTVRQRQELGYAGNRPILVRSGRFRASHVDRSNTHHYENISTTGSGFVVETGSDDERDVELQRGTRFMPARPVNILDDGQEARISDVIDFVIRQIEQNLGIR